MKMIVSPLLSFLVLAIGSGFAAEVSGKLPEVIETQEQWDALPGWQKDLLRMQWQGISMTQEQAARYAMDYIRRERMREDQIEREERAREAKARESLDVDYLRYLMEYSRLVTYAEEAARLVEALPDGAIGPWDTRWNNFRKSFIGGNPKFIEAMSAYNRMKAQVLGTRGIKSPSKKEMEHLLGEIGDPWAADVAFKSNIRAFAEQSRAGLLNHLTVLEEMGYVLQNHIRGYEPGRK